MKLEVDNKVEAWGRRSSRLMFEVIMKVWLYLVDKFSLLSWSTRLYGTAYSKQG